MTNARILKAKINKRSTCTCRRNCYISVDNNVYVEKINIISRILHKKYNKKYLECYKNIWCIVIEKGRRIKSDGWCRIQIPLIDGLINVALQIRVVQISFGIIVFRRNARNLTRISLARRAATCRRTRSPRTPLIHISRRFRRDSRKNLAQLCRYPIPLWFAHEVTSRAIRGTRGVAR